MKRFLFSYVYDSSGFSHYHTLADSLLSYSRRHSNLSVSVEFLERGVIVEVTFDDDVPFYIKRYCKHDIEYFCDRCYLIFNSFQSFSS